MDFRTGQRLPRQLVVLRQRPVMRPFTYTALPQRVKFGFGTSEHVADEIRQLGCKRALVLTTPQQVDAGERVRASLGDLAVGLCSDATMHTPMKVTKKALDIADQLAADCVVSVGGGSTIGLGKALALHSQRPIKQIVIPTTYAGSEATPIIGQTDEDKEGKPLKTTQRTMKVLPDVIVYDVDLTMTLPAQMTITSGLNAIAHAVEALYAPETNPVTDALAVQGIEAIARSLPVIHKDPNDKDARSDALYGAWTCGTVLGTVGMSLHHKLCHTLGGSFGMPHAETHTVVLPHAVAYNAPYAKDAMAKVASAVGVSNAAQGLFDLANNNGAPTSLRELGFKEEDLELAADIASKTPYPNPAPLEKAKLLQLLTNAYNGTRPA